MARFEFLIEFCKLESVKNGIFIACRKTKTKTDCLRTLVGDPEATKLGQQIGEYFF